MPVKWLSFWQPNEGSTVSSQILNEATQCIESLNGVKEGKWKTTLNYYKPMLRDESDQAEFPREFVGISLPDEPSKYYFVIRTQRIVMEADLSIQQIMEKLQSYKCKLSFYFEGFQYQLGDFRLRVGKVIPTHAETIRGIVMEVEYLPISSMERARKVMEEFLEIWREAVSKRSLPAWNQIEEEIQKLQNRPDKYGPDIHLWRKRWTFIDTFYQRKIPQILFAHLALY